MQEVDIVTDNTLESRKLDADQGIQWLRAAFRQFKAYPFIWLALTAAYLFINFLSVVNQTLSFFSFLISPVINAGLMVAASRGDSKEKPRLGDLLYAFKADAFKLIVVGALWGLIYALFVVAFLRIVAVNMESATALEDIATQIRNLSAGRLALLFGVVYIYLFLSIGYAVIPGLIVFDRLRPFPAYHLAFAASLRNWRPIAVYLLIAIIFGMLASMLFFIGWVVFLPVIIIANFYIWKDLFTHPKTSQAGYFSRTSL